MAGVEAASSLSLCSDVILLVDASNAFNSLNCIAALYNMYICQLCPPFATLLQYLPFSSFLIYLG